MSPIEFAEQCNVTEIPLAVTRCEPEVINGGERYARWLQAQANALTSPIPAQNAKGHAGSGSDVTGRPRANDSALAFRPQRFQPARVLRTQNA
jgi:hypothetical protein